MVGSILCVFKDLLNLFTLVRFYKNECLRYFNIEENYQFKQNLNGG